MNVGQTPGFLPIDLILAVTGIAFHDLRLTIFVVAVLCGLTATGLVAEQKAYVIELPACGRRVITSPCIGFLDQPVFSVEAPAKMPHGFTC